ncbi:thiol-disulfide oxidoreductase DCC family protein [bacterium]|nr:MAG: thiol-disulfide oxidoreductase DCC family protein [bacterium]
MFFFDGVCNLCNGAVDWIVRHDPKATIKFASLQGETAAEMIPDAAESLDSMVFVDAGRHYRESDAVLRAGKHIGGVYGVLAAVAGVFPRGLRNAVYRFVARNRYRWFGKKESCRLPTPAERSRFLP